MQLDFAVIGVVVDLRDRRRGRPVIAITALDGGMAGLCRNMAAASSSRRMTALRLLQRCASASANPRAVVAMGRRARAMLDAEFARQEAFARRESLLDALF
jgi:hypothetical protein